MAEIQRIDPKPAPPPQWVLHLTDNDDITEEGHQEIRELETAIGKFLEGYSEHYVKGTASYDDIFLD